MFDFSTQRPPATSRSPNIDDLWLSCHFHACVLTDCAYCVCLYTIETFPSWMRSLGLVCDKGIDSNLESKRCSIASLSLRHVVEWRDRERLNVTLQTWTLKREVRSPTASVEIFWGFSFRIFFRSTERNPRVLRQWLIKEHKIVWDDCDWLRITRAILAIYDLNESYRRLLNCPPGYMWSFSASGKC